MRFSKWKDYTFVHMVSLLRCKQQCVRKQSTLTGKLIPDYLPGHYNHLQYAYYKLNEIKKAVSSVASYLLLNSSDEMMQRNRLYYLTEPGITHSDFQPDQDAVLYIKRRLIEDRLLAVAETQLNLAASTVKGAKGDTGDDVRIEDGAGHFLHEDENDDDDHDDDKNRDMIDDNDDTKDSDADYDDDDDDDEDLVETPISDNGDGDDDVFGLRDHDHMVDMCPFGDDDDDDDASDDNEDNDDDPIDPYDQLIADLEGRGDDHVNVDPIENEEDSIITGPKDETRHDEAIDAGSNPLPLDTSLFGRRDAEFLHDLSSHLASQGVKVSAQAAELRGTHRVAADGLLTEQQCQSLIQVARKGVIQGDGYDGYGQFISPHTRYEKFEGLTVGRATALTLDGTLSTDEADLFLSASEKGRTFLEKYYNLQRPLYYHFTHLVCRTALPGDSSSSPSDGERSELLSHPVHSDNCIIQSDGSCLRQSPAYVSRHLTGLIYLNADFEGGEFFWAYKNQSIQKTLSPKCGRFVGFESSDYHGVKAVLRGQRCAVAMWYTFSGGEQEMAHVEAREVLHDMKMTSPLGSPPALQSLLTTQGYILTRVETQLGGSARFVADGITTKEESDTLIKLTLESGVIGDGYTDDSHTSPHTQQETFIGLSMHAAAELASQLHISADVMRLYLDVSERTRHLVATYFHVGSPLYFAFTHLVCQQAVNDSNSERTDFSQPVHADNCLIQSDGSCLKERPAYFERDYSAVVYLNSNFSGGDFFFADNHKNRVSTVKPQSGRVVGFQASTYHGVYAVKSGQRCALDLWFTLDWRYRETAHDAARVALQAALANAIGPPATQPHHGEL